MLPLIKKQIINLMQAALSELAKERGISDALPVPHLERPKVAEHGDIATNIAMQLAKAWKLNPRELAQAFVAKLATQQNYSDLLATSEVAGPGFINLRLTQSAKTKVIGSIFSEMDGFGKQSANDKKVLVEFVSANPTGPLHVGHGRQAALGDVLSSLLQTQGLQVHREFYYNDAGVQIQNLAISVQARAKGFKPGDAEWPELAYNGEYIAEIARDYKAKATVSAADGGPVVADGDIENVEAIRRFAVAYLRREQDIDLQSFGIKFDCYYLESSLYSDGSVESVVSDLKEIGKSYDSEGALWLRTTDDGDDKDRVMRKSDGSYTYFVPDVAYHASKWSRGFTHVINIQGSDHHGTIARVRSGIQGVAQKRRWDIPKDYPQYVLHKMVTVMKGGEEVKISKRAGSYVTVRDLIEWSGGVSESTPENELPDAIRRGRDAVRFFLISRKADTEFVFDVDLALKQNDENPVFYVQYAHARICSILRQWAGDESLLANASLTCLTSAASDSLLRRLAEYPDLLTDAARDMAPHAVAFYLRDLASEFHSFYNADRVLVDDEEIRLARLALLSATKQVIANGLGILGVSAPNKM
ncbi:arginine--tRNA ligase [Polynucleobacter sp. 30F-ANTBAC]|uniref:arginine--tRNA ligase n=1 Tax=Polynucleobacter sp. 30F-ANTBAC TaxID=2689095 RepID=UPI001C0B70EE|nr:arginine--tRNA ligase [Polynucleobacter sp. 30F-ANTBAC]MBU3600123.1 arginine--tRNA ligase [Polynucleobacter sp. 30F-ANTBAC]